MVRFARLIHRRGRDVGGPSARAACGGTQMLPASPRTVAGRHTAYAGCLVVTIKVPAARLR
jgi:hypothetical protein